MPSNDRSVEPESAEVGEAVAATDDLAPGTVSVAEVAEERSGRGRDDDLVSRLEVVESQPLADRAAAYEVIRDDLARRLEHDPVIPG